jgi:hypothetical protein
MIADGQGRIETDRLFELGRFMQKRLREKGAWKTFGCVFLDMRTQTVNAAMRYLGDHFTQTNGAIHEKRSVPKDLVKVYELEPVVAEVFDEFLEATPVQHHFTSLKPSLI